MDLRIAEIIREQLFLTLGEEVPYATFVEITEIEQKENLMKIMAYVTTETDSQKYIVIGKNGAKINEIGTKARIILEDVFDKRVFLALRVKTLKNWRKNTQILEKLFPKK
jgi:GTP-binding protein Era